MELNNNPKDHETVMHLLIEQVSRRPYIDGVRFARELSRVQCSLSKEEVCHLVAAAFGKSPESVKIDLAA